MDKSANLLEILLSRWTLQGVQCQFANVVLLCIAGIVAGAQVVGAIYCLALIRGYVGEAVCKQKNKEMSPEKGNSKAKYLCYSVIYNLDDHLW